jgi:oligopeptide/dipeptide ABC transporter, ATP-binding protein, C-terminal domain
MNDAHKPILEIRDVYKYYDLKTLTFISPVVEKVKAVRGVTLKIIEGETIGLVGESGCGKSTLSRLIVKLEFPLSGTILFDGKDIFNSTRADQKLLHKSIQLLFQNPFTTLSPQMTIGDHIADVLTIHHLVDGKTPIRKQVFELLDLVGVPRTAYDSYPENFSGGALQMVNIARAMAVKPKLLISDEGVSILDVSDQARVLNLLRDLQKKFQLTCIIVTHDLSVIRHICERIAVMYLGKIVELGPNDEIFSTPAHPYTRALIDSIPTIRKGLEGIMITPMKGEVPSPINLPSGCTFHPRCLFATDVCSEKEPQLEEINKNHSTACHHWKEVR